MITLKVLYGIIDTLLALVSAVMFWDAYGHDYRLACLFYACVLVFFATLALDQAIPDGVLPDDPDQE